MNRRAIMRCLTGLLTLGLVCAMSVFSGDTVKAAESGRIVFYYDEEAVSNAQVKLYQVGAQDGKGSYELKEQYAAYQVDLEDSSAAKVLASYIQRDDLAPDQVELTDAEGKVVFDELESAVYLILSEDVKTGDMIYRSMPVMLQLPAETDGSWDWDVTAYGKVSKESCQDEKTGYSVNKVWSDNNAADRPEEIQVQLLKDGQIYDEQTLSEANNWRYTWDGLETGFVWSAVEKAVPKGYVVSTDQRNSEFYIVNKKTTPGKPHGGRLPQTGVMWWPVVLLINGGLLLIFLGLVLRRKNSQ